MADLNAAVTSQNAEAAATLASLNASVWAQQKRIDAAAAAQEKTDAKALDDIGRLRGELRAARLGACAAEAGGRGAVVVAPQVQPAPVPAIVREVEPKPPGYFQSRRLQRMTTLWRPTD